MFKYSITILASWVSSLLILSGGDGTSGRNNHAGYAVSDALSYAVTKVDTPPGPGDPTTQDQQTLTLPNPSNMNTTYELNEEGTGFDIHERVGNIDIRHPSHISTEDYIAWRRKQSIQDYWKQKNGIGNEEAVQSGLGLGIDVNNPAFKDIFGGGSVEIRPTGTALLEFSGNINRMQNPSLPVRQQRTANFNFDQQIQLNVVGKIGEKLRLTANWDTEATFDFENQFKIEYTGTEDEILQKIEAGNVSLPLRGSLISGGQNLFGVKMAMKFGPLTVTAIASQQKGKTQEITVEGGSQVTEYEKKANDYDVNRHFFLGHHFRARYEQALSNLPNLNSGYVVNRIEVWITNTNSSSTINNRNAVGFVDLGEQEDAQVDGGRGVIWNDSILDVIGPSYVPSSYFPHNEVNPLYGRLLADTAKLRTLTNVDNVLQNDLGMENGFDYERVENMRMLQQTEYTLFPQLGYISLNSRLQDNQVLFVAYEYLINGQKFEVGEFSQDKPADQNDLLFLKMLKPSSIRPVGNTGEPFPTWDLMMKNIYNMGGYGLRADNFRFEIYYQSPTSAGDIAFLPDGQLKNIPLLQVFNMDKLTNNSTPQPDNIFDFIEGITINSDKGLIKFPVLEPFGQHVVNRVKGKGATEQQIAEDSVRYAYTPLYRKTQMDAIQLHQDVDRYVFKGSYQSASSSEISLNAINIANGSVKVTANGTQLIEGTDYTVDYQIGKVNIVNAGLLTSGQQIKVAFETNTLFGIESKTLVGTRLDLNVDKDIQVGATVLHLNERPLTQKINIGDEPLSNTMLGADIVLRKDSRLITKYVDKLPMLSTKEISTVTSMFEVAGLLPGHPKAISVKNPETGVVEKGIAYLDDFESSKTTFDLSGYRSWQLAAFPGNNGNNDLYDPRGTTGNPLDAGYTRAKMAWYNIDPNFFFQNPNDKFPKADLDDPYSRQVNPNEVFPNKSLIVGDNLLRTFDMYYVPNERGPYNYQADPTKLNDKGKFTTPEENWAGIMRRTSGNTDFEASNYEFIEFWLLDPFIDDNSSIGDPNNDGVMYLNLGKVSEDILPDNRRSYENGLPENGDYSIVDTTAWGFVPNIPPTTNAFSNDENARQYQDVGFDGMPDELEAQFDTFATYLSNLAQIVTDPDALAAAQADPSSDNYKHFRDGSHNDAGPDGTHIYDRYKDFNNSEGNTPIGSEAQQNGYSTQGSPNPDTEDINVNGTLNSNEEYWEYKINLKKSDLVRGRNFVVDEIPATVDLNEGSGTQSMNWYQFRIPLTAGTPIGGIQNFKSVDFVRLYMTGFEKPVILRFAKMQLVSTTWRTYKQYLGQDGGITIPDPTSPLTTFEIGTVNIEDNGSRYPFPYNIPPNVLREQIISSIQNQGALQNEQSLVLKSCNLQDGDARGAYRVAPFDLRSYQRVKMWVHAEDGTGQVPTNMDNGDVNAFIRLGTDNNENYYEYEIPLKLSRVPYDPPVDGAQPFDADRDSAWQNEFNFMLDSLALAKAARNVELDPFSNPEQYQVRYRYTDGLPPGHAIYVVGTPKISEVKSLMVGLRNPDDGKGPVCVETWFNELRVVDFNEQAGMAATGRINIKLADFGTVSATGSFRTPGFGSLEQRINDRSREFVKQYDLAGNFQLGKFFPQKWGMEIPLYLTYGQRIITPQFSPLESDVLTEDYLNLFEGEERDKLDSAMNTVTTNRSVSLNNIRKTRTGAKKPQLWDIENWALSFAVNETDMHSPQVRRRLNINHRASIKYNFNFNPKLIKPFKNAKHKNPITEFNFYPLPKSVSFNMQGNRRYEETQIRPTANQATLDPTYFRDFRITRNYSLRWDLTRSLSVTYNAMNQSRVDEPLGHINPDSANADSVWDNLLSFNPEDGTEEEQVKYNSKFLPGKDKIINIGRNMTYNQSVAVNYVLPFDKYPWTNWLSGTVNYQGNMNWAAGPDNNPTLGNMLGNSNNIQGTGRLNMQNLYDKVPGLKKFTEYQNDSKGGSPNSRSRGRNVELSNEESKSAKKDTTKDDSFFFIKAAAKEFLRILTSVKNVDATYNRQVNTTLPGYLPNTDLFGMDFNHWYDADGDSATFTETRAGSIPPDWKFAFGWADAHEEGRRALLVRGREDGWLSKDSTLSSQFIQSINTQLTGRTSVTLFKDFKVDLNISRNKTQNYSALLRYDDQIGEFVFDNQIETGTFSMSYIFLGSAFDGNGNESGVFNTFKGFRSSASAILAGRDTLADLPSTESAYVNGYLGNSQEVLLPSFLAAYGSGDLNFAIDQGTFPKIPLPNWTVNYNGLSRLPGLKSIFNSVSIKHTYRATYNITNFTTNQDFDESLPGGGQNFSTLNPTDFNYESAYNIQAVGFRESFAPLIGINMNWENGLTTNIDFKTDRTINFNLTSLQVTETKGQDLSIAVGWRKDKMNTSFSLFGKEINMKNALNARFEFTLRDRVTRNRNLDEGIPPTVTGGNLAIIVKPTIDYTVNRRLNVMFFVEQNINRPHISTSYPSSFTSIGFRVRFTLN